jgi:hypothetical protein
MYLASDALAGRGTGTPGNDSAARYVVRRFEALGLLPVVTLAAPEANATSCASPADERARCLSYFQPFAVEVGDAAAVPARNVVALVRGTDARLRDEYVIVGAHYDHLGRSSLGALDPASGDTAIRNGADDDASGTAAVLELARLVARRPARRTIVFAAFGAEELGRRGSRHFVDQPPVPLRRVRAMLDFDMVGRLRDDRLIVDGVATASEFSALLDSANAGLALRLVLQRESGGASDDASFSARGVPALRFFTGLHADYHRATDDADRVDVAGEARVVTLAERVLRALADGDGVSRARLSMF